MYQNEVAKFRSARVGQPDLTWPDTSPLHPMTLYIDKSGRARACGLKSVYRDYDDTDHTVKYTVINLAFGIWRLAFCGANPGCRFGPRTMLYISVIRRLP